MTPATSTDTPTIAAADSFYHHLCESVGSALVVADLELKVRLWNAAAARMFGAGAELMLGAPVTSILPQERREAADRLIRRVIRTGEVADLEYQDRDAHGERCDLIASVAAVTGELGVRVGASLCFRDITRRIALQNELGESRKMSALAAMAGGVAHHFNNILGGIITGVDYAKGANDPAVTAKVLDQTSRALIRASALVNGLLAFSEGGRSSDDLADFTELMYELADQIEGRSDCKSIAFTLNAPKLPVLPVARMQVQTILRNIVQNAIESMPQGGRLGIDVALEDERIVIAVTDTGCGLDEAARAHIFEPFWSTKSQFGPGGCKVTGLGLAIAYGLVQVLGGSISVTSQVGEGSCFKISLPRPQPS